MIRETSGYVRDDEPDRFDGIYLGLDRLHLFAEKILAPNGLILVTPLNLCPNGVEPVKKLDIRYPDFIDGFANVVVYGRKHLFEMKDFNLRLYDSLS